MIKKSLLIALSITVLTLSSCFNIDEVKITEIKSVKLLEFSDKGLLVESNVKIHNPNNFDIKVVGSDFKVKVNKKAVGNAHIKSDLLIPASSDDFHTLILESTNEDLAPFAIPNLIAITASGSDKFNFKVDGFIEGKVWWFKKKVAMEHEGDVVLKLF